MTVPMADNSVPTAPVQVLKPQSAARPNYNALHAQPLPLTIHPLPPLIPHNPLSLLYIAFTYLRQTIFRPSSHDETPYRGYLSIETRSVHVTDEVTVRALWEHGFFGKGSLSRSEPTWLEREKKRRGLIVGDTAEEITRKRREERKAFKKERARKLREEIELKLKAEANGEPVPVVEPPETTEQPEELSGKDMPTVVPSQTPNGSLEVHTNGQASQPIQPSNDDVSIVNEEHLQLDLFEAFFLSYALGVLEVFSRTTNSVIPRAQLLPQFLALDTFPPRPLPLAPAQVLPDNKFILFYVVYHHFRSLGWIVRPGIKFGVDFLLYNRGPVFSHAEFAVVVLPAYEHSHWKGEEGKLHVQRNTKKEWHWLHMVNRVQSQVKKTLVLCFVGVPPPWGEEVVDGEITDIGRLLKKYKVREVLLRRWAPNRTRD